MKNTVLRHAPTSVTIVTTERRSYGGIFGKVVYNNQQSLVLIHVQKIMDLPLKLTK